jgi:hypothetical protein
MTCSLASLATPARASLRGVCLIAHSADLSEQ